VAGLPRFELTGDAANAFRGSMKKWNVSLTSERRKIIFNFFSKYGKLEEIKEFFQCID